MATSGWPGGAATARFLVDTAATAVGAVLVVEFVRKEQPTRSAGWPRSWLLGMEGGSDVDGARRALFGRSECLGHPRFGTGRRRVCDNEHPDSAGGCGSRPEGKDVHAVRQRLVC